MTLADTSVWVEHFRRGHPLLARLLTDGEVGIHPFVIGELACGNLKNRRAALADLACLPQAPLARDVEAHHLLESKKLWGSGLGWVDVHLLASAALGGWTLLTLDRALLIAAESLGIAARKS